MFQPAAALQGADWFARRVARRPTTRPSRPRSSGRESERDMYGCMQPLRSSVRRALVCAAAVAAAIPSPADAAPASVNLGQTHQTVRGFGGASVWLGQLSDAHMNTLFGTGPGTIGLSILRVRIAPDNNWNDELQNARKAIARGAIVIATPWTPPASMKTNNNPVGGKLKPSEFANYAGYLQGFANFMAQNGAGLFAISVQNEPDIQVTYESCDWTASDMLTFARNNAGAISTRVLMAESFNFK